MTIKKTNRKQNYVYVGIFLLGAVFSSTISHISSRNEVKIDFSEDKKRNEKVLATVNGSPLYRDEIENALQKINQNITFGNLDKETQEVIIKEVAVQKSLMQNALKYGTHKNFQNDDIKDYISLKIQQSYLNEVANKRVTDEKIQETYDKLAEDLDGKKEYKIQHILLKTKSGANRVKKTLSYKSFEDAAKQYSIDKDSADNGGNLGYVVEGVLIPEFDKEIKKLSINKASKPFKTNLGWHIVKLIDKRDAVPADFKDVKEKIRSSLVNEEKQSYVKSLIEETDIEILDSDKNNSEVKG